MNCSSAPCPRWAAFWVSTKTRRADLPGNGRLRVCTRHIAWAFNQLVSTDGADRNHSVDLSRVSRR